MKIIILGAGKIGTSLAIALAQEGNEITLIDEQKSLLDQIRTRADLRLIQGNGAHPSILEQADSGNAEMLVALTDSDETNLMACKVANTLFEIPMRIARAQAREYLENEKLFEALDGTALICPEKIASDHVERLIRLPGVLHMKDFAENLVQLAIVRVPAGFEEDSSRGGGIPLRKLAEDLPGVGMHIAAIYRDSSPLDLEQPSVYLLPGDELFVLSATAHMHKIIEYLHHGHLLSNRKIMIAGGGSVGTRVVQSLAQNGGNYQVTVLEQDENRARMLPEILGSSFLVLHGDATDKNLLTDENIDAFDMFCAVTNHDEVNILASMLAKRLGARTTLALVNKPSYTSVVAPHIDIIVSSQQDTLSELLTHIRRGDVVAVHSMHLGRESVYSGSAEILEALAHATAGAVGKPIGTLNLPKSVNICVLVRNGEVLFPNRDSVIEPEDRVIVFLGNKREVRRVERMFQVSPTFL